MVRVLVLGSSCLVSTEARRPTHLACLGSDHGLLVDCGVSPRGRLEELGIGRDAIDDIFITHFHPDHAAGLPLFLMEMHLQGRRKPVNIYGGGDVISRLRKTLDLYRWKSVPEQLPVSFRPVKPAPRVKVLENPEFRVWACAVRHVVPTLGVRVDLLREGRSFVFSADTEPSTDLAAFARGAGLLIHEATGEGVGHSTAGQAAAIAREAGVEKLLLIHVDPYADGEALLAEARAAFPGKVEIARDKLEVEW
jgi:ribonuclease Z